MKPKFSTGDLCIGCGCIWGNSHLTPGIVIGVSPSNSLPDGVLRGIERHRWGFVYYVLFADPLIVRGPLVAAELLHATELNGA